MSFGCTTAVTDVPVLLMINSFRLPSVVTKPCAWIRQSGWPGRPLVVATRVSPGFSQWKAKAYGAQLAASPAELEAVLRPLVDAGVDVLHPSTRRHYQPAFADSPLSLAGWTKKVSGLPVISVGSVGLATEFKPGRIDGELITPAPVDRLLEQYQAGEFDIVAVGRALLPDPGWVNRLRDETLDGFSGYHAETALASLR